MFLVVLEEAGGDGDGFLLGFDAAKDVALADGDAAGTADEDVPFASFVGDNADVFGGGFGAVAGAAGDGHFDFGGGFDALEFLFDGDAEGGGIVGSKAAPIGTDAGFAGAEGLGVGVAGSHGEVLPDGGEVFFFDAQEVDALAAGEFDGGDVVFFGDDCRF